MFHRHCLRLCVAVALGWSAAGSAQTVIAGAAPPAWRPPVLQVGGAEQPVRLRALQLDVEVVGRVAQTRVAMEFLNPNDRVLEGTLRFPLAEGQVVSGFALDVDGQLRDAVPVEKARAQQVFEDISRRRVDPGLLQTTLGNNYELRIYPLPPGGTRTVVLTIVEPAARRLAIPLNYAARIDRFELRIRFPGAGVAPLVTSLDPFGLRFERDPQGGYSVRHRGVDVGLPAQPLGVLAPAGGDDAPATVERRDGQTFFAVGAAVPDRSAERTLPAKVQLVWDASGSAANRRRDREYALLDAYFRRAGSIDVDLVRVADTAGAVEPYAVRRGDWQALRRALEATIYDGASNLGAVAWDGVSREALWFTDGLANYGASWSLNFPVPVYAINSATTANPAALRALADASGGRWIDLTVLPPAAAAQALLQRGWQLIGVEAIGARDVVAASSHPEQGGLSLAGVMTDAEATLTLRLRRPDGGVATRVVRIGAGAPASRLAAAQWARLQLARLQADARHNRTQIREVGRRFGLATAETSLIVLERVEDYVEHEIEPPPSLRAAYERLGASARQTRRDGAAMRLAQVVRRFEARSTWWATDFPKGEPPRPSARSKLAIGAASASSRADEAPRRERQVATAPSAALEAPKAAPAQNRALALDALKKDGRSAADAPRISIVLKAPSRTAAYARRLQAAAPEEWLPIYLDERREYAASVGFYLDIAEFFFEHDRKAQALRTLSNLAELDLQNRQVLRLLGYRLVQAGEPALALPVFERVLELAPHEPQSHRDLGLALAQAGQPQRAIERLYDVVTGAWDSRFPDIELIALTELNGIADAAARAGTPLATGFIEPRLLRNLPLDLRVVLAWDADNTDVDLHVIDPNGEEVYYGHNASYQGGAITRDATGGYGPEEFALKLAKPGKYRVDADFYGHRQQVLTSSTGLMLWLSSGYGTARQQDRRTTVRVRSERGERVLLGEFEVGR